MPGDLGSPSICDLASGGTDDLEIGLFIYNATLAVRGRFLDVPVDDLLKSVTINCAVVIQLCKLFGSKMAERGRGGIGIVSAMGATAGSINYSVYNAGKAFQWILAETLWSELAETGVDVATLLAGSMPSPGYERFIARLDPVYADAAESTDLLAQARARLFHPVDPDVAAKALYDHLSDGPVCFSQQDDERAVLASLALPRGEAVALWRGVQETPLIAS
jgi:short-subunit dehydrogenase